LTLRAALVTPLSGPLTDYGRAGAAALRLWADRAEARLAVHDAYPDPVGALHLATAGHPDLLFGPYGSGPTAAVVAATERLVWNHGGARVPAAPNVVSVLAPAETYWAGAVHVVAAADPTLARVTVLHGPTGFGRAVGGGAAAVARALGVAVTVAVLPAREVPDGDLLLVAGGFAEEREAGTRLLPGRWRAAGFVGAGVDEVLAGLGHLREGLLGPAQWLAAAAPEPDLGPGAADFVAAYQRATGTDPPYPAAQAFAAGLVAERCARDAGGAGDEALRAAAAALECTTLFGRFRLAPSGEQLGHQVLTVQWQDGKRRVVWPPERAQGPVRLRPAQPNRAPEVPTNGTFGQTY
jgi:branched-chain amino acid transport system substrate-binding protein